MFFRRKPEVVEPAEFARRVVLAAREAVWDGYAPCTLKIIREHDESIDPVGMASACEALGLFVAVLALRSCGIDHPTVRDAVHAAMAALPEAGDERLEPELVGKVFNSLCVNETPQADDIARIPGRGAIVLSVSCGWESLRNARACTEAGFLADSLAHSVASRALRRWQIAGTT